MFDRDVSSMLTMLKNNPTVWVTGTIISLVLFVGTIIAIPIVCVRMPRDVFVKPIPEKNTINPFRTALAIIIIALGAAMLVLPGQGLLTILIGVSLLDFPKKRVWQRKILQQSDVRDVMNAIRKRAGKPPFEE